MGIKQIVDAKGKKKYQAQVWFKSDFICSAMFDSEAQAKAYHTHSLGQVAKNSLVSAAERREQRLTSEGLNRSMLEWAKLYVEHPEHTLSRNRKAEYLLVGRLTGRYTL